VNWDPKLLTAISDLEVAAGRGQGAASGICAIRWKARHSIPKIPQASLSSPPTAPRGPMLGDHRGRGASGGTNATRHLVGKHVILPLVGRKIPIVADEYFRSRERLGRGEGHPRPMDFNDFESRAAAQFAADQACSIRRAVSRLSATKITCAACRRGSEQLAQELHGVDRFRRAQADPRAAGRFLVSWS